MGPRPRRTTPAVARQPCHPGEGLPALEAMPQSVVNDILSPYESKMLDHYATKLGESVNFLANMMRIDPVHRRTEGDIDLMANLRDIEKGNMEEVMVPVPGDLTKLVRGTKRSRNDQCTSRNMKLRKDYPNMQMGDDENENEMDDEDDHEVKIDQNLNANTNSNSEHGPLTELQNKELFKVFLKDQNKPKVKVQRPTHIRGKRRIKGKNHVVDDVMKHRFISFFSRDQKGGPEPVGIPREEEEAGGGGD